MRRFGAFEVDFEKGELRKSGIRIRVQEQPLRILEALLAEPGETVGREQLRERLWPSDTFVDFERSLNAAVAKLRQALNDSAEQPMYVETVARKGYRFIAPITVEAVAAVTIATPAAVSIAGPVEAGRDVRSPSPAPLRWSRTRGIAVAAASVGIIAAAGFALRPAPVPIDSAAFSVPMPEGTRLPMGAFMPQAALSPDGLTLAFVSRQGGSTAIWLRPIGSETSQKLQGAEGASLPFWSPDGKEIGFFAGRKLKKIARGGGVARVLCDAEFQGGASWGRGGTILFSNDGPVLAVPDQGGTPREVLKLDKAHGEVRQGWPQFLPDGKRFLYFSANSAAKDFAIYLASLDGETPRMLFRNPTRAVFSPPNYLLFVRGEALWAQRWDLSKGRKYGEPVSIVPDVNAFWMGLSAFNVSESGGLVYRSGVSGGTQLAVYSRGGKPMGRAGPAGDYAQMTLSPDEKMAALQVRLASGPAPNRIWLLRLDTNVLTQFDFGKLTNSDPVWSPDSRQIAFARFDQDGAQTDLMVWTLGEQTPRTLFTDGRSNKPDDWSPDGRFLLCRKDDLLSFTLPLLEGAKPVATGDTSSKKDQMHLSPDGKLVAYGSLALERPEIFVARFPEMTGAVQVSDQGGIQPIWRGDGRELFYIGQDNQLMSVEIKPGKPFEASAPRPLFRLAGDFVGWGSQYGVSADGQRVYVLEPVASQSGSWHVVTHWNALLPK
ncbi:MAG: winged helix-turn-helix domain-containing protein [Candidatus Solibacter sp.]